MGSYGMDLQDQSANYIGHMFRVFSGLIGFIRVY